MSETFWATVLGAFLSAGTGAILFFIQRWVQRKDDEKNLLFKIYQTIRDPLTFYEKDLREFKEREIEIFKKWTELEDLSLLVKDKELRKDIYCSVRAGPFIESGGFKSLLDKIEKKLNKKLLKEIRETKTNETRGGAGESGHSPE